jgi:hypothetical protein
MLLPSLALGICVMSTWITCLQASLSSELRSLRQIAISSAFGMNALQSLNASGVHAARCSGVPCENEGAGQAAASSRHRDIPRARYLDCPGVCLSGLFVFIKSLALIETDTRPRQADIDTRRPERGLVVKHQHLYLSTLPCPTATGSALVEEGQYGAVRLGPVCINGGPHKLPSDHTFIQALSAMQTLVSILE